jgi:hypothetical protein
MFMKQQSFGNQKRITKPRCSVGEGAALRLDWRRLPAQWAKNPTKAKTNPLANNPWGRGDRPTGASQLVSLRK